MKELFARHQKNLLRLANNRLGRRLLRINGDRSSVGKNKIIKILPNAITWIDSVANGRINYKTEFRSHDKFAKRIYYVAYPILRLIHEWDTKIANKFNPKWNLGLDILGPIYSSGIASTSPIDGAVARLSGIDEGFTTLRNGAGDFSQDVIANIDYGELRGSSTTDQFSRLVWTIHLFDTASIPDTNNIDAVVLSAYGRAAAVTDLGTTSMHAVASTPASDSTLANSDYGNFGTTDFGSIALASWTNGAYNDITMNASGEAHINKTGLTKYGIINTWHLNNSFTGTWSDGSNTSAPSHCSGITGTNKDPKLVVTHSVPESASPSLSPSASPSASPSPSSSVSLSISLSPSASPSPSSSVSLSPSPSSSVSLSPSSSDSPSPSSSPSSSASLSQSPSSSISLSPSSSESPSVSLSPSSSISPSPSASESLSISLSPSSSISLSPSASPSLSPSPSSSDSPSPSSSPSSSLSLSPSVSESSSISLSPSPSSSVSLSPSSSISASPSPSISPPPALINSGRVVTASDSTASATLLDIDSLSTTVDIVNSAEIFAVMTLQVSSSSSNKTGSFTIEIDGTPSPIIVRKFTTSGSNGSVTVIFRSGTLGFGSHTITGQFATDGGILTATNATIVAFALEDTHGNVFKNAYDTVASDTSTSTTLEDIDGLTQDIVMDGTSHLFGMMAVSAQSGGASVNITEAISLDGQVSEIERTTGGANSLGSLAVIARTATQVSGTQTVKGQHAIASGTVTTAPSIVFGMELGSEDMYEIPTGRARSTSASTASSTFVDITDTSHTVNLTQTTEIMAVITLDASCTATAELDFTISINGVDQDSHTVTRTIGGAGDDGAIAVVVRTASTLTAGSYTVVGRWKTSAGTASLVGQANIVSFAMENATAGSASPSLSPSASASPSSSVSLSPSVSESRSPSLSPSPSSSPSLSISLSPSASPSSSVSLSPSSSESLSASLSPSSSISLSPSSSESPSVSLSPSSSISPSPSASESPSVSLSPSSSISASPSPSSSVSLSPSSSESRSPSASPSLSPSATPSSSPSASISLSPSQSDSPSPSASPSSSVSPSPSLSPSVSPSASISPSPSAPIYEDKYPATGNTSSDKYSSTGNTSVDKYSATGNTYIAKYKTFKE